jgi:hypothetical protein
MTREEIRMKCVEIVSNNKNSNISISLIIKDADDLFHYIEQGALPEYIIEERKKVSE